jgi:hypothetical protein
MNNSKIMSVVITAIAAALLASSTVGFASYVFAQKDDSSDSGSNSGSSSGSSSSTKDDYDKFQKCLSDAATDGSATKQQVKDCFDSTYGGGSSSGSDNTGSSRTGSDSGSNNDNNKANN